MHFSNKKMNKKVKLSQSMHTQNDNKINKKDKRIHNKLRRETRKDAEDPRKEGKGTVVHTLTAPLKTPLKSSERGK